MDYNTRAKEMLDATHRVGRISKIYGAEGGVVVKLYDALDARELATRLKREPLWIEVDSIATPFFATSTKNQGVGASVVTFDGIDSVQKADMLIGMDAYLGSVEQARERATDWAMLEGFRFEDVTSGVEGEILEVVDNSLNPLLYLKLDGIDGEHYVPVAEELIVGFDKKHKLVSFELVEGFFEAMLNN